MATLLLVAADAVPEADAPPALAEGDPDLVRFPVKESVLVRCVDDGDADTVLEREKVPDADRVSSSENVIVRERAFVRGV